MSMMGVFRNYHDANALAQVDANTLQRPMAIEKANEYGRTVYRVKMLPRDLVNRFGWETRCEVVDPEQVSTFDDVRRG